MNDESIFRRSDYKATGIRRTASFSNIIQENVEEEDEQYNGGGKSDSKEESKRNAVALGLSGEKNNKITMGNHINSSFKPKKTNNRGEKSYFETGSIRNSARDEEFFNYFQQLLEEVITKMKKLGGSVGNIHHETLLTR